MEGKENNIHAGHRKRFRDQIESTGLFNVSELHFLEYLLMYVIPRADTNPTAHALIKEFKSIQGVFEASERALMSVHGVGPKAARFLKDMLDVRYMYNKSKAIHSSDSLDTVNKIARYIRDIAPISNNEQIIVLILNKAHEPKNHKIYTGYSDAELYFDLLEIKEFLLKNDAKYCVVAHTHPSGKCEPSQQDNYLQGEVINPIMAAISVVIVDAMILCEKEFYTYRYKKKMSYADTEESRIYKVGYNNYGNKK